MARQLLGARLIRVQGGQRIVAYITETEAYIGERDQGCHASAGLTPRTAVMYGEAGHAYVYFTYGNHWMLNVVTEREGMPAAVLIRAVHPIEGIETVLRRRQGRDTFGPGKLTQALRITGKENGTDLASPRSPVHIEEGIVVQNWRVTKGPRVGLTNVPEPWKSKPWRFLVKGWRLD